MTIPPVVVPPGESDSPLTEVWSSQPGRGISAPFALDDSSVYLGGSDRRVEAVSLASGKTRWSLRLGGPLVAGVLYAGGVVYAPTDQPGTKVFALRVADGRKLWGTSTGGIGAPLSLINGLLIAQSRRGVVMALDPATGAIKWRRRVGPSRAPAVEGDSGVVIVATIDSLFRLNGTDGKVLTRIPTPGVILSSWVRRGTELIAGTTDSLVIGLRASDLTVAWKVRADGPILSTPAVQGDTLYAATAIGGLFRVTLTPEPSIHKIADLSWPVTSAPVLLDSLIVLGGADGTVRAFGMDGNERWRLRIGRPAENPPRLIVDGFLALGGRGDLHRYRQ
ncbi:MAG: PQQ-binding-like beta-propeller repeat protein [Gemmatimonadota bacterium]